jgi:hypothetical protein
MSIDSGHLRDLSVDGNNINIDVNEKVYEDVDWTPVNYGSIIGFLLMVLNVRVV